MYDWRKMDDKMRQETLAFRKVHHFPLHSPPHCEQPDWNRYHLTAACYEHKPVIGVDPHRMSAFCEELKSLLGEGDCDLFAWCVLPNHWHALIGTDNLKEVIARISHLHGCCSFKWNGEDCRRGRKCWCCCADRRIRSDRHFYVTRNYIHNNPVKHGYVKKWDDWVFSSAIGYLDAVGRDEALDCWRKYPVKDMGKGWDEF